MSNTSVTNVTTTDTFQVWLSKTNDIINVLNENVMLAGPGAGFTIQGNSTLQGSFTSNSLISGSGNITDIVTSTITRKDNANQQILFNSPIRVQSSVENIFDLQSTIGNKPILRFINGGSASWLLGTETETATSAFSVRLSTSANPQIVITQNGRLVVAGEGFEGDGSRITNINANNITSGTLNVAQVPNLDASKITSGTIDPSLIPNLDSSSFQSGSVSNDAFRPSVGLSVVGRGVNSTGSVADISAGTNHQVLRRSGASLGFGAIALNQPEAVSGVLPPANGGTGQSSFPAGRILFGGTNIGTDAALFWDNTNKRLGINISSPTERLQVNGNVKATLFIGRATSANYADLAEKFEPDQNYPAGTVVYIGGSKEITGSVKDCKAIGVVSEFPALMMNAEQKNGVYVALKGRVPVFVIDKIKKGDILIPTDNGKAIKGDINSPNVLGIALSDSKNGKVEILVL